MRRALLVSCLLVACGGGHKETYGRTTLATWQTGWSIEGRRQTRRRLDGPDGTLVEHVYELRPNAESTMALVATDLPSLGGPTLVVDLVRPRVVGELRVPWESSLWTANGSGVLLFHRAGDRTVVDYVDLTVSPLRVERVHERPFVSIDRMGAEGMNVAFAINDNDRWTLVAGPPRALTERTTFVPDRNCFVHIRWRGEEPYFCCKTPDGACTPPSAP